jgi:hypothetical protein
MAHFLSRYEVVNSTPVYGVTYEAGDDGVWTTKEIRFSNEKDRQIYIDEYLSTWASNIKTFDTSLYALERK